MQELIDQVARYEELTDSPRAQTRSPVLQSRRVGPWRLLGARPATRAGSTLVLLTSSGELRCAVRPLTASQWAFGHIRRYYEVDTTQRRQTVVVHLPCRDGVLRFRAELELYWQVVDAREVVDKDVHDGAALFTDSISVALRLVSREFEQDRVGAAETALNRCLAERTPETVSGVVLRAALVQIDKDTMLRAHELIKRREEQQVEVTGIRREHLHDYVDRGQQGLLTYHLTQHPEDALTVVDYLAEQDREGLDTSINVVRALLSSGALQDIDVDQEWEQSLSSIRDEFRKSRRKVGGGSRERGRRSEGKSEPGRQETDDARPGAPSEEEHERPREVLVNAHGAAETPRAVNGAWAGGTDE